jgi:TetR/AcrR family transcriptional regulator, repressor for uid operon
MRTRNPDHNTARRAAIIEAAAVCFVERGFHATSMKDVCAAAGMSPGTLYHYFRSKPEIIAGIVEDERRQMHQVLAPLATAPDLIAALEAALEGLAGSLTDRDLILHAEVAAEVLRDPQLREQARITERETVAVLAEAIARAQASGEIAPGFDPGAMATIIGGLVDGLLMRAALEGVQSVAALLPAAKQALARLLRPGEQSALALQPIAAGPADERTMP